MASTKQQQKKFSGMTEDEALAELEWITEAIGEGYTKKQLAKQYGCSVPTLNKFLKGDNTRIATGAGHFNSKFLHDD